MWDRANGYDPKMNFDVWKSLKNECCRSHKTEAGKREKNESVAPLSWKPHKFWQLKTVAGGVKAFDEESEKILKT